MFKKKNLSVILAVVLLCASVAGVLFIGTQAAGTKYYMTVGDSGGAYAAKVPSDMTFIANYSGVAEAVAAARSGGRTWAKDDTLTIYVANSSTTAIGSANSAQGRQLFGTYTIFRADNTKLPITIDGDDPSTSANEKYALPAGTFAWKDEIGVPAAICANDYTFKNLDMSSWANTNFRLYSGSGRVTFDTVTLGTTSSSSGSMHIFSQVPSQTAMTGWSKAKWEANRTDGLLDSSFTFINTTYGYNTGTVATRSYSSGVPAEGVGTAYIPDMTVTPNMFRNKIVIGNGANIGNPYFYSKSNKPLYDAEKAEGLTAARAAGENVIEVLDGATVSVVYGIRNNLADSFGYNLICNVKGGNVGELRLGPTEDADTYTGNITLNWTGGMVKTYTAVNKGTVDGDVFVNVKNTTLSWSEGLFLGSTATVTGTLHHTLEDCTVNGQVYLGAKGKAKNIENTLKGTIKTSDNNIYCGSQSNAISGNITNNVECVWTYTGTSTDKAFWCGSQNGEIAGTVFNNVKEGADVSGVNFYGGSNGGNIGAIENSVAGGYVKTLRAGSNGGTVGSIVNKISGGEVGAFSAGNGPGNAAALDSIKSTITGGVITNFYGASGSGSKEDAAAKIGKVENVIGMDNGDGTYSGDAHILHFYGGNQSGAYVAIGEIENTFYSGKLGHDNRDDISVEAHVNEEGKNVDEARYWFDQTYYAYGGSSAGIVGKITNTIHGGIFNTYYYFGGNAKGAAFGNAGGYELQEGESQITNYVYGGHFARFAGGSNGGNVSTVKNYVRGSAEGSISVRSGAFYCGHGASGNTTIVNEISGFAPVDVGNSGVITEDTNMKGTLLGGSNSDTIGSISTVIKNDAVIGSFFGGCNGGKAGEITTTIMKESGSESEPDIDTYYGGGKVPTKTTDLITNNMEAGFVKNFYGGDRNASATSKITALENNLKGGKIHVFYGGNWQNATSSKEIDSETGEEVTTTVYALATIESITNSIPDGSTVCVESFYGAGCTGNVDRVVNKFESAAATLGATYGGLYGTGSFKIASQGGIATDIQNVVRKGTFEVFTGGSRRAKSGHILNSVTGGTFGEFYGANNQATLEYSSTDKPTSNVATDFAVYTVISNATVNGNVYGGSYLGEIKGHIKIVFSSGTFNGDTFSGNRFGNITGTVTGTVNGGTFNRFFGGSDGLDLYGKKEYQTQITGKLNNYINGGTFTATTTRVAALKKYAIILKGNCCTITGSVTSNYSAATFASGKTVYKNSANALY